MTGTRDTQSIISEPNPHARGMFAAMGMLKAMILIPIMLVFGLAFIAACFGAFFIWGSPLQMSFLERYGAIICLAAALPIFAYARASRSNAARLLFAVCLIAFVFLGSRMWWSPPPRQDLPMPCTSQSCVSEASSIKATSPDLSALRVERKPHP